MAISSLPFLGPTLGRNYYVTPTFWGISIKGDKNGLRWVVNGKRAAPKRKNIWFLRDRPDQKWPKSGALATKDHILNTRGNFSPTVVV